MLTNIKAVLYDADGVLISGMVEGHYEALNRALKVFGYSINPEDHIKVFNGLPTSEKLKMMSKKGQLPYALHDIIKNLKKIYTKEEVQKHCKPDYSKIIMLQTLKNKGLKLACCSNAIQESVEEMLKSAGIIEYFDLILGNDQGFKPKPEPDIYLEAMRRLELKPEECLIVEDSFYGIQSAKASGGIVIEVSGYSEVHLGLLEKYIIL
jgi:beta-phosphoglucomutase